jgi:hypothetical protein
MSRLRHRLASLLPTTGLLLALLVAAGSVGCDKLFFAELKENSRPEQPVFRIGSNPDFSGVGLVYEISIQGRPKELPPGADTARSWHLFWDVRVDSGHRAAPVSEVTYGAPPVWLHDSRSAESLPAGFIYEVDFHCLGLSPLVYFEIYADAAGKRRIRELTQDQWQRLTGPAR